MNTKIYKIGTLARECGVSPNLLRIWEKRYTLFDPIRGPGNQRLYNEDDLFLLRHIAETIKSGRRIGELAALGRERLLQEARIERGAVDRVATKSSTADIDTQNQPLERYRQPLIVAAKNVDGAHLRTALAIAELELSPDKVVYEVILPAMQQVGEEYLAGRIGIAGEHLVSNMVDQYLGNLIGRASRFAADVKDTAICCCFPGEEHRIGLLAVAYTLAREGWNIILLGSAMPLEALEQIILQVRPASVWLSVTGPDRYNNYRSDLAGLADRHQQRFIIGGQGVMANDQLLLNGGCVLFPSPLRLPADIHRYIRKESQIP